MDICKRTYLKSKMILYISLPLIIAGSLTTVNGIIDLLYISRVSDESFAAVTMGLPLYEIALVIAAGISSALAKSIAEAGADNVDIVDRLPIFWSSITMVTLLSFAFIYVLFLNSENVLNLYSLESGERVRFERYLDYICAVVPIQALTVVWIQYLVSIGRINSAIVMVVTAITANAILDPIFIFHIYGDERGAAAATMTAWSLSLMYGVFSVKILSNTGAIKNIKIRMLISQLSVATPVMIALSVHAMTTFYMTMLAASIGTGAVIVYGAISKVSDLVFIPVRGVSAGIITLLSKYISERDVGNAIDTCRGGVAVVTTIFVLSALVVMVFSNSIISAFGSEMEVYSEHAKLLLIIFAVSLILFIPGPTARAGFIPLGYSFMVFIGAIVYVSIEIYVAESMIEKYGVIGLGVGTLAGATISGIFMFLTFRYLFNKKIYEISGNQNSFKVEKLNG